MKFRFLMTVMMLAVGLFSCKDRFNPIDSDSHADSTAGTNLIRNSGFNTANQAIRDLDNTSASPWLPATGTPQLAAGYGPDNTRGFLQMWGDSLSSESVTQVVSPTHIEKGKRYSISSAMKVMVEDPEKNLDYAIVDFYAVSTFSTPQSWYPIPGLVKLIGSVKIHNLNWQTYTLPDWIADAGYEGIAIQVRSDYTYDNSQPGKVSWAHIDDVVMIKK